MEHFVQTAKQHPYVIGGGVAVGALLIFFMFKKPAATGGTYAVANQTDDTAAQINAQLVMAQDAVSAQTNQAQFALETTQANNATAVQLAQGANATSLAGAQINATTALAQSAMSQQTSLLNTATAAALQSQQTGLEAGLENEALNFQHFNDVYSDYATLGVTGGSSAIEAAAVAGNGYAQAENTAIQSGPLGAGNGIGGFWNGSGYTPGFHPSLSSSLANSPGTPAASTTPTYGMALDPSDYLSGLTSVLQSIQQRVALGDPTATPAST